MSKRTATALAGLAAAIGIAGVRAKAALVPLAIALLVAGCAGVGPTPSARPPTPSAPASATPTPSPTLAPDPNRLMTIAGGGSELGDGGPASDAGLCNPTDVAVDSAGNVYVSDGGVFCSGPGGHSIRRIDPDGIITTYAGSGVPGFAGDGGPATSARLNLPISITVDRAGNLYIADQGNNRIRKVDANGIISTLAGTGEQGYSGDGGPATAAQMDFGELGGGLALDDAGNLYVAAAGAVRKIEPSGTITTVAGTGVLGSRGRDGDLATQVNVNVVDVAVDGDGNLYLSEYTNGRVRRVAPDGTIATFVGGGNVYLAEGVPATSVGRLTDPWGLAVGPDGALFYIEHHVSVVRRVTADGIVTTVAGIRHTSSMGQGLFNGEEGPATHMNLNEPIGLFVDAAGILYIADTFNQRVRVVHFAD